MGIALLARIKSHRHIVLATVIGMTVGILIVSFAYFSSRSEIGARVFGYGVAVTGHSDIDEDLLWFLCGGIVGGGIVSWAWWRDDKARTEPLEDADVLNRIGGPSTKAGEGHPSRNGSGVG